MRRAAACGAHAAGKWATRTAGSEWRVAVHCQRPGQPATTARERQRAPAAAARDERPRHLRMPGFARRVHGAHLHAGELGPRAPDAHGPLHVAVGVRVLSFGRRSGGSRSGGSCAGATCPGSASEPPPSSLPVSPSPAPSRALSYGAGEWDGRTAQRPLPTAAPARHRQLASSDGDASH